MKEIKNFLELLKENEKNNHTSELFSNEGLKKQRKETEKQYNKFEFFVFTCLKYEENGDVFYKVEQRWFEREAPFKKVDKPQWFNDLLKKNKISEEKVV